MSNQIVHEGDVFGKTTVLLELDETTQSKRHQRKLFLCQCECGAKFKATANSLLQGHRDQCGYCAGVYPRPAGYGA